MIELIIVLVLGIVLLMVSVYLVDRKRRQLLIQITSDEADYVSDSVLVDTNHEVVLQRLEYQHIQTKAALKHEHSVVVAKLEQAHSQTSNESHDKVVEL